MVYVIAHMYIKVCVFIMYFNILNHTIYTVYTKALSRTGGLVGWEAD